MASTAPDKSKVMRVRTRSLQLFALMPVLAAFGAAFLFFIGHDALEGRHPFQFFADSNTYHEIYAGDHVSADNALLSVASNYLGPLTMLELAQGNIYLVMLLNTAIFTLSMLKISSLLNIDPLKAALIILLSPLTISSLLSVNKEIFIFPFFACALAAYAHRSFAAMLTALVLSVVVRWQFTLFYVVLVLICAMPRMTNRRTTVLVLLAAVSAAYALMQVALQPVISAAEASFESYDGVGSGLFELTIQYQDRGLYWLVFPLKAAHLLFGMGLRLQDMLQPVEIYNDLIVGLHSAIALVTCALLAWRGQLTLRSDLLFASAIFLAIFCLSPIFAPRYLYAAYVAAALVVAGAPMHIRDVRPPGRARKRVGLAEGTRPTAQTEQSGWLHTPNA